MPYLDRDRIRIYYEEHGSGSAVLLSNQPTAFNRAVEEFLAALAPGGRGGVQEIE